PVSRHHTVSVPERAPTEISTLSLHDALPILPGLVLAYTAQEVMARGMGDETVHVGPRAVNGVREEQEHPRSVLAENLLHLAVRRDRKSTRLDSSHVKISYAVFCLKKKKNDPT